jgi:hypothetical protein
VKTLTRIRQAIARLIEAYQEDLLSLEELRQRLPPLRQREGTAEAQLASLEAELTDAETYVTLAESLEGFLARLHEAPDPCARRSAAGRQVHSEGSADGARRSRAQAFDPCSREPSRSGLSIAWEEP